jgi:nonribosomal peptide synthetase protein VioO
VFEEFVAAARRHPGREAIVAGGKPLTYAELEERVRAFAHRIGPNPGVVGVPATHSPDTVTALLGVWAAGGVYCPVDPAFPQQRREAMLRATLRATRPDSGAGNGLAYALFTSGSTGEPKPVLTPHTAIAATVRSLRDLFDVSPADRVLQFASLNWDTCFEEILPALTSGACVVFHEDAYTGLFPRFLRMVERERITVLDLPTAFWHELVTHLSDGDTPLPACVRLVIIGGEAASPARLADWCMLPTAHARLLNTYGCTETTLITHAVDLSGPLAPGKRWDGVSRVPIGRPLPHVVEHVTGDGELLIGGPALADGYGGLPEATAARFVSVNGQRYFRTGDRVGRLPDGTLVHEGRVDDQVKIRGVRVDPAEVEAHIAGHPAVRAVLVTGVTIADHTALAAYVVPRPRTGTADLDTRIADYLRARVPAHLIPSRIHLVADLVYTASGKVDRHRSKESMS